MNRIFSVLLSLQLIIAPVPAMAESNTQNSNSSSQSSSSNSQNNSSNSSSNSNKQPTQQESKQAANASIQEGVANAESSQTNPQYDGESQHEGGFGFYAKQVLAISTSIIGGSIIEQCALGAKLASIMTFMAGSLVYIASELAGAKSQNGDHESRIERIKQIEEKLKSQGGEVQREMLNQRLKEEIALRDYFKQKRNWMIAVTAIYFTAMALAIMEETTALASATTTGTMLCAQLAATYASPCGPGYAACYAAHFAACLPTTPIGWMTTLPNFANPAAPTIAASSCASATLYMPACLGHNSMYHALAYAGCMPLPGVSGMIIAKLISMAYSTGLTRSSGSPAASYVVMLSGLLMFFVPSLQSMVVAMYNYPIPRSITFGISAALATAVTAGYASRISVAESNIEKLQNLLAHYRSQTDDDTTLGADVAKKPEEPRNTSTEFKTTEVKPRKVDHGQSVGAEIKELSKGNKVVKKESTCISKASGSIEFGEKACATPLKVNRPSFNVTNNNKTLKDAGNLTFDLAQAVSEGNVEKADAVAGQLGSMASKIKDIAINLKNERAEILKRSGVRDQESGELADHQKQLNDQIAKIQMDLVKSAQEHKMNISVADLNLKEGDAKISDKALSQDGMKISTVASNNVTGIKSDITPGKESGMGGLDNLDEGSLLANFKEDTSGAGLPNGITEEKMDTMLSEQNSGKVTDDNPNGLSDLALRAARANGYAQLDDRIKRYGIKDDGVSNLSDESIFKQISTRYFMNYSKISIRRQKVAAP